MATTKTARRARKATRRDVRRTGGTRARRTRKWSRQVAERSDALDLQRGVFTSGDPRRIARSLKRSAESSTRRKAKPFQSAMSMLNLYINRAGRTLPAKRRRVLERAKQELRIVFGRTSWETGDDRDVRCEVNVVNKSRNRKNQPPSRQGKHQSTRLGAPRKLGKRSEVVQAQRNHPELNLGDADDEAASREGDQRNPARPKAGR